MSECEIDLTGDLEFTALLRRRTALKEIERAGAEAARPRQQPRIEREDMSAHAQYIRSSLGDDAIWFRYVTLPA